jgi:phosphocarrier protein
MTSFEYTITDPVGIHARPAGMLVKEIKALDGCSVSITKGDKTVNGNALMKIMGLGIKQGETVTVVIDGGDEETAAKKLESFFKANL